MEMDVSTVARGLFTTLVASRRPPMPVSSNVTSAGMRAKAMKAAMTAVLSNGIIRAQANTTDSVREILSSVNPTLFFKTAGNVFVAVCIASIDASRRQLEFVNAGLMKPLLKSKGKVGVLEARGRTNPLGMIEKVTYEERRLRLNKSDVLLFYTDGISDAQNETGEFYGEERLSDLLFALDTESLSAEEIKKAVFQDVRGFSGSAPQNDDMTVVVVKVV